MPASEQTDKSRYPSKYSAGNFITAAQYIVETICEKRASIQKKHLGQHFWKDKEWAVFYKQQILAANGLLKIYSVQAILNALKNRAAYRIYSLRAPHLDGIIEQEEKKIRLIKEQTVKQSIIVGQPQQTVVTHLPKQTSVVDKLKELE